MRLNAAFRASHDGSGLGHVQFLPVTKKKRLALTGREFPDFLFNQIKELCLLELRVRTTVPVRTRGDFQSFQRVGVLVVTMRCKRGEERCPERAHLPPAEKITDRVLQDALEEKRKLDRGLV